MALDYGELHDPLHQSGRDGFDDPLDEDSRGAYVDTSSDTDGGTEVDLFTDQSSHWMTDNLFSDELVAISEEDWKVDADDIWDSGAGLIAGDVDLPGA